ncbi:hypothetical protein ACFL5E_00790 [Candidatus Omnitrophota bacterium]
MRIKKYHIAHKMFGIALFLIFFLSCSISFSNNYSGEPGKGANGNVPGYRRPGRAPEPKKDPDDSLIDKDAHPEGFDFDTEVDAEDSRFYGESDAGGEGSK